ncbi:hypothetical protein KO507_12315 [Gilvimarinus agarilyticus]|uniref:hypothetical protein n=1 Tax=Gilvimarinus sp. 2_MG-2023 TaxID=3062666 RepID=UPI001C09B67B|nr:hypothetical protein [Gilvimarinus sp. 2_MG-2023]MBU2886548.1 hypothetical protein [Gilvimarinus agarilyticus]MDO6571216.1 hypothetical protein [Gilvimarinus sp. 2_MG-2023]
MKKNGWLMAAGVLTAGAALMHVAIIFGGAEWYRFFGAGEKMAQMAEQGLAYPAQLTGVIALVLFSWALYGFSGAGAIPRLPFMRAALGLISFVFLLRGLFGVYAVLFFNTPFIQGLGHSQMFLLVSSAICLLYGLCYAIGTWQVWTRLSPPK